MPLLSSGPSPKVAEDPTLDPSSMLTSARRLLSKTCAGTIHQSPNKPFSTCLRSPAKPAPVMPARSDEEASAKAAAAPLHPQHNIKDEVVETQSLSEQCERVHRRVCDLLERPPGSERVRQVQQQTRISLGVIGQALEKYR